MRTYYRNQQLEMEAETNDNLLSANVSYFYQNGQIKYKGKRVQNKFHGEVTFWYPNGNIWQEVNYHYGDFIDSLIEYYPDGILKAEGFFKEKGNGLIKYYHHNSSVSRIGQLEDNLENGKWVMFDSLGRKRSIGYYQSGKKQGDYELYDTLGNVIEKGLYHNDILVDIELGNKSSKEIQKYSNDFLRLKSTIPWSKSQKDLEISDCVKLKIQENHRDPNTYCKCKISKIEQHFSYQDYLMASEIMLNEIMSLYNCD